MYLNPICITYIEYIMVISERGGKKSTWLLCLFRYALSLIQVISNGLKCIMTFNVTI